MSTPELLDRRTLLAAGGLVLGGAALALAGASGAGAEEDHSMHGGKHPELVASALACVGRGEACAAHCIELLSKGDTTLAACLGTVNAMLPACAALARLAAIDAPRLKQLALVCADICDDCEKECRKHADTHAACKACGEACVACSKACRAVAG